MPGEISRREKQAPSQTQSSVGRKKLLLPLVIQRQKKKRMNCQKTEVWLMISPSAEKPTAPHLVFALGL